MASSKQSIVTFDLTPAPRAATICKEVGTPDGDPKC